MAVRFRDLFGGSGSLDARAPDVGSVYNPFFEGPGGDLTSMTLDGSGHLQMTNRSGFSVQALQELPGAPGTQYVATCVFKITATGTDAGNIQAGTFNLADERFGAIVGVAKAASSSQWYAVLAIFDNDAPNTPLYASTPVEIAPTGDWQTLQLLVASGWHAVLLDGILIDFTMIAPAVTPDSIMFSAFTEGATTAGLLDEISLEDDLPNSIRVAAADLTDAADTLTASDVYEHEARLAVSDDGDTLEAAALAPIAARLNVEDEGDTLEAKAVLRAERRDTLTATATVAVVAQLDATDDADGLFARGEVSAPVLTYPDFPQWDGTRRVGRSGLRRRKASNGAIRPRATSSYARYDPIVVHRRLSLDEFEELKDFETSARSVPYFNLNYQPEAVTIKCIFAEPPFRVDPVKGAPAVFNVTSNFLQVRA